jgi:hypothetical protein
VEEGDRSTHRALVADGHTRLEQLANLLIAELEPLQGVRPRAVARLQTALEQQSVARLGGLPNLRD